jgi:molecular chaperone GrpE
MADSEQNEQDSAAMTTQDQQEATPTITDEHIAELEAQLEKARAEAAANWDKYLRERAEMDNFRKVTARNAEVRARREKADLLNQVFDVMDNLDRAMKVDESSDRESLLQGLRLVQWQFSELLTREGITPVSTVGEVFDPHVHEAVEKIASDEHPEGTVAEEVRKGYLMGDETLRPARVRVSAGK